MAQKMSEVGGVPLVFTSYGTSTTPVAITVTTPKGFLPTYVRSMDNTATNPNTYEWYYGMPAASAIVRTGATGVSTYISSDGFTVAAGSIIRQYFYKSNFYSLIFINYFLFYADFSALDLLKDFFKLHFIC